MNGTTSARPGLDIRCMNVKFSPNLGDGLLSECLEAALVRHGAGQGTRSIDLAARRAYGDGMVGRGAAMALLQSLPPRLRGLAVRLPLAIKARRSWGPHYAADIAGADAMVIGGGNLLSDHDLNFPTKLALALSMAHAHDMPCAIFACGMANSWSAEGDRRLRRALTQAPLRAVFLRDAPSAVRWDARFGGETGLAATVVRDPGLLASRTYKVAPHAGEPAIGLGIMSHVALTYHARSTLDAAGLGRWYLDLARALRSRGRRVISFTNGAPEDVAAAEALAPDLTELSVEMRHRPRDPAELARIVAGCSAIAAFRMHAVIAAHSFAVPALALAWDDKLQAFMASVGREDWLFNASSLAPEDAAERLVGAAASGLDTAARDRVLDEAERNVSLLYAALSAEA